MGKRMDQKQRAYYGCAVPSVCSERLSAHGYWEDELSKHRFSAYETDVVRTTPGSPLLHRLTLILCDHCQLTFGAMGQMPHLHNPDLVK